MYVLGIDIGITDPTATILVDCTAQPLPLASWIVQADTKLPWDKRVWQVHTGVAAILNTHRIGLVVWAGAHSQTFTNEKTGETSQNLQTMRKLAAVEGVLIAACGLAGVPWVIVQESQSKNALAGDTRASKQTMIDAARMFYRLDEGEHVADALAHALAGEAEYRRQAVAALAPKAPRRKRVTA